jgi:hypothetical protein
VSVQLFSNAYNAGSAQLFREKAMRLFLLAAGFLVAGAAALAAFFWLQGPSEKVVRQRFREELLEGVWENAEVHEVDRSWRITATAVYGDTRYEISCIRPKRGQPSHDIVEVHEKNLFLVDIHFKNGIFLEARTHEKTWRLTPDVLSGAQRFVLAMRRALGLQSGVLDKDPWEEKLKDAVRASIAHR